MREEKLKLKEEMEQMKRQIENNSELRMTVERDAMILRAKVESYEINIEELDKLRRQHILLHDEVNKLKSDNSELNAINKELIRQREVYKSDFDRLKQTLDSERKQLEEFKVHSEKSLSKLRQCIEEERYDYRDKLMSLEREVIRCKKEKDENKAKYNHIIDKLENKLSLIKDSKHYSKTINNTPTQPIPLTVSVDDHKQLKKELKLMKKKQNQLSSLLNCTFESTHCKEIDETQT